MATITRPMMVLRHLVMLAAAMVEETAVATS